MFDDDEMYLWLPEDEMDIALLEDFAGFDKEPQDTIKLIEAVRRLPVHYFRDASTLLAQGIEPAEVMMRLRILPEGTPIEQLVMAAKLLIAEMENRDEHYEH